jgi:pimeloyl-ACP methyl ester carboxylesterase
VADHVSQLTGTGSVDGPVHWVEYGGPEDGPFLVGVHGLGGSHLNWAALAPRLTDTFRVVAVDLLGHGRTPLAGRTASIATHRALLDGFLRQVVGRPAVLVGNSMGGLVSALQAAEAPGTVAGLVLVDPALPTGRLGLVHPRVMLNFVLCAVPGVGERYLAERAARTSPEQHVRRVLGLCCVDPGRIPDEVVAAHVALTASVDRSAGGSAYLDSARSLSATLARPGPTVDRLACLDGQDVPVLLLHGARDVLIPLSAARRMAAAHPAWRFEIAREVGHAPQLEAAEWTAGRVRAWLAADGAPALAAATGVPAAG